MSIDAELLAALEALVDAIEHERKAQDAMIRALSPSGRERTADAYEDACATTIIRENVARAAIRKARGGNDG